MQRKNLKRVLITKKKPFYPRQSKTTSEVMTIKVQVYKLYKNIPDELITKYMTRRPAPIIFNWAKRPNKLNFYPLPYPIPF